ncbi:MAG: NAD-dependent epimerase/dehydratase family protein, partial [Candidatus Aminicenantes bacterium]|nr:NAD-dependent epimerase/dehydratase family protein [Candidatus Aminicenantes bacterium]
VRTTSNIKKLEKLNIELVEGDLAAPLSLMGKLKNVDLVFHIAALYRQEGLAKEMFFKVNLEGTRALLEESLSAGVKRFIHCSTVGVQGEIKNPPAKESAPYNPGDHYQESKVEGEKLALHYFKEKKLDVVVVRPLGIYGPGDTRFLKLFKYIYNGKFRMIGKGNVLYHLTFVEDLVRGIILAGENPNASGQAYAIGGKEYVKLNQLVEIIALILNKPVPQKHLPLWPVQLAAFCCEKICRPLGIEPPLYPRRLDFFTKDRAFDISKAQKELGYNPEISLKEGLTRTAEWYLKEGRLENK